MKIFPLVNFTLTRNSQLNLNDRLNPSDYAANSKITETKKHLFLRSAFCDRDRIQTCNRLIRSQLLYSVELRDPFSLTVAKVRTFDTTTKH